MASQNTSQTCTIKRFLTKSGSPAPQMLSAQQIHTPFKRKLPLSPNHYLGSFTAKAYATLTLSVHKGQRLYYRLPKNILNKGKRIDKTVRLATNEDAISNAKLGNSESEVLYTLIREEILDIEFYSIGTTPELTGLESFSVEVTVYIRHSAFVSPGIPMSPSPFKSSLISLFSLLRMQSSPPNMILTENSSHSLFDEYEQNMPEVTPSPPFTTELFPFQKQGLSWMLQKETGEGKLSHLWEEYYSPSGPVYFSPYTGQVSREFPIEPNQCTGGILADESGLGKTITSIALIQTRKKNSASAGKAKKLKLDLGGTLVLVPSGLIRHWKESFEDFAPSLRVVLYHCQMRVPISELKRADVVLTSYGVLELTSHLHKIKWFRIMLDDGHCIKSKNSAAAKSCCRLQGLHRWVVTATPLLDSLDDLFSLVKFLSLEPCCSPAWWSKNIVGPYSRQDRAGTTLLKKFLRELMLRRTKQTTFVSIPQLTIKTEQIEFSSEENSFYEKLHAKTTAIFTHLLSSNQLVENISPVFELLIRLRQFCNSPDLIERDQPIESIEKFITKHTLQSANDYTNHVITMIQEGKEFDCPVCLDAVYDPVITKCCHIFCRLCAVQQVHKNQNCPMCKQSLKPTDLKNLPKHPNPQLTVKPTCFSSKIHRVIALLREDNAPTVVFSQWAAMIDLLALSLEAHGIPFTKLTKDSELLGGRVVLAVFRAGAAGAALTFAHKVVILEPCLNPAVELQAIQRVHRIGQTHPVTAIKLVCRGTIEEKLVSFAHQVDASYSDETFLMNLGTLQFLLGTHN